MAYSPFAQPYIRAGIHHIVATLLFTLYAMRVSPFINAIPFVTLFFQTAAFFLILHLIRFSFYLIGSKISALIDIALYAFTAILYAYWHQVFYQFPIESNVKVAFGILLIGSFVTIDLAITHARVEQNNPSSFVNAPKIFIPIAVQIGFVAVFLVLSLAMLFSLIMSSDLLWVSQHDPLYLTVDHINTLVRTFLIVAFIIIVYAVCIIRNATALVQRQLAYQVQALNSAAELDFDNKVPMNTLGEFSIIAFYTNNMLYDLTKEQEKESPFDAKQIKENKIGNSSILRDDNFNPNTKAIHNLAALISARESKNRAHIMRIQRYVKALATELAKKEIHKADLTHQTLGLLFECSPLYDIGKLAIPDNVLKKSGKLSDSQFAIVKTHPQIGAEILQTEGESDDFYRLAQTLALTHHEWWNGTGYPNGLKETDIPLVGRIMALADTYDALISTKSYRSAYDHHKAKEIIVELSGVQFDPDIVDAFIEIETQFADINRRYRDELLYTLVN